MCHFGSGEKHEDALAAALVDETNRLIAQQKDGENWVAQLRALTGQKQAKPKETGLHPSQGDLEMTRFLSRRIEEANLLESYHLLPDGRPWCQQAAWKTRLWLRYLQGRHESESSK